MADTLQILRQWLILRMLGSTHAGLTLRDLAHDANVNQKTISRDLQTLKTIGFPIEQSLGKNGLKSWRLRDDANLPKLSFNLTEAMSLYIGRRLLEPLSGTLFWEGAQTAFAKIRASLGPAAIKYLDKVSTTFHQTATARSNYTGKGELLDTLMIAIEDRKVCDLTYQSERSTEPVSREIHPYGVTLHEGALYLVAFATDRQAIRTYKLDRITDAVITSLQFPKPTSFNLADYFAGTFGVFRDENIQPIQVRIRFDNSLARYIQEKTWHPSQALTPNPDGTLTAEFQLTTLQEITRWVMSFGGDATVLEPPELRETVCEKLRGALLNYVGSDGQPDSKQAHRKSK